MTPSPGDPRLQFQVCRTRSMVCRVGNIEFGTLWRIRIGREHLLLLPFSRDLSPWGTLAVGVVHEPVEHGDHGKSVASDLGRGREGFGSILDARSLRDDVRADGGAAAASPSMTNGWIDGVASIPCMLNSALDGSELGPSLSGEFTPRRQRAACGRSNGEIGPLQWVATGPMRSPRGLRAGPTASSPSDGQLSDRGRRGSSDPGGNVLTYVALLPGQ